MLCEMELQRGEQEKDILIDPGPFWRGGIAAKSNCGVLHLLEALQFLQNGFLQTLYCLIAHSYQFVPHY